MTGVLLEAFPARMAVCDGMMGVLRHRGPMLFVVSGVVSALVPSGRLTTPVMTAVSIVHSHLRWYGAALQVGRDREPMHSRCRALDDAPMTFTARGWLYTA